MDIAALIWEKSDFYVAMIEDPEAVKELAGKVRNLLTAFFDEWFKRYGTRFVAHFPPYYMEGGMPARGQHHRSICSKGFIRIRILSWKRPRQKKRQSVRRNS